MMKRLILGCFAVVLFILSLACLPASSDWTRRDMPLDGLTQAVTYNLRGPAGSNQEVNRAYLRGVNDHAPTLMQEVIFDKMPGSKTQDIKITLPDGKVVNALGMIKTKRFAGLSQFLTLESATYSAVDLEGNPVCGAKIRLSFTRNLIQYADSEKRDWDSLWYYDIPCQKGGKRFRLDLEKAQLRALVVNQVWQARVFSGSIFWNWGHSVTIIGGPAAELKGGWWTHWDLPKSDNDTMGAVNLANAMVIDLENSPQRWVEFNPAGPFKDAYLIYSAGDADQYLNWNRMLLDRQQQYVVLYRPDRNTSWDFVTIRPVYNFEWNDVHQNLAALNGWSPTDPMKGLLDASGMPKDPLNPVVKEFERIGWMNAPNASLEQIQFIDPNGKVLYAMTVRAFIGARDTLVMFGGPTPRLSEVMERVVISDAQPMPVLYDDTGKPLAGEQQQWDSQKWARWQREATMWNFLRDNPSSVRAELEVQYRFADNTTWKAISCGDYICGYDPVEWNLSASYYFDNGDVRRAWLVMQLLGEVGVRTLGLSYASGLYSGTGMLFAMGQRVLYDEFYAGFNQESVWTLDARASVVPGRLNEAWRILHEPR